jgi:cytochrome c oxidase assembly protein subunit 15
MPFDDRSFPSLEAANLRRNRRIVAAWLLLVSAMIWAMVVLGGATRLTGSGLSIMEWAPLSGALPPLSHAAWQHYFDLYKQIPQYKLLHPDMDLNGFQQIFWLEWVHRNWGRLMGVVFLGPLAWFTWRGIVRPLLAVRLLALFALGALQGAIGWFMVASGFEPDSTAVSPYRLVIHLALALTLFAGIFWTAMSVLKPVATSIAGARRLRLLAAGTTCAIALTIVAGGFTAGTHAGLIDNTFPLMDGRLVPAGYVDASLHPVVRNLTENVVAVQFDHRLLATLSVCLVLATALLGLRHAWRGGLTQGAQLSLAWLAAAVSTQYVLGIATLVSAVAIPVAVTHQAFAVMLLAAALCVTHNLRGAR